MMSNVVIVIEGEQSVYSNNTAVIIQCELNVQSHGDN